MSQTQSYRQILRSSVIMGGASAFRIAAGIVLMKATSLILGPVGVGLIGLLQSLMATASAVAGLGLGTVGARQIAEAASTGDEARIVTARRALYWATLVLAFTGGCVVWFLRDALAVHVLGETSYASAVGWLGVGVGLTVASTAQTALLAGLRRVGDLAWISVCASVIAIVIGIPSVLLFGINGVALLVIASPAAAFLCGQICVARSKQLEARPVSWPAMGRQLRTMIRLGSAVTLSGIIFTAGLLVIKTSIHQQLGAAALGHFEAAWLISVGYLTFMLNAMSTDYFPRLTAVMVDRAAAARLVNEQTEVVLLLSAPAILAMWSCASWVIRLLYSVDFAPTVEILRWQLIGDVLKIMSWPLAFVMLAANKGRLFAFAELSGIGIFVLVVIIYIPFAGVKASGVAYLAMYMVYLPLTWWLGRKTIEFYWTRAVKKEALIAAASLLSVGVFLSISESFGACLGLVCAAAMWARAFLRLSGVLKK